MAATPESIADIHTIVGLIDYLSRGQDALAALTLVVTGAFAWIVKSYVSAQLWAYHRRTRVFEIMLAIRTEIDKGIRQYIVSFNEETKAQIVETINEMRRHRRYRDLITASNNERMVFDHIKGDITILPTEAIGPVVAFYTAEQYFGTCYDSLGSPATTQRGYEAMLKVLDEVYLAAADSISSGQDAIRAIDWCVAQIERKNQVLFLIHAAAAICGIYILIYAVTRWPF